MTQTKFKKVPFDIELAKKITKKKVKGHIVTKDERQARIISLDKEYTYPITVLIEEQEEPRFYCENGSYFGYYENPLDLHIELPTYYEDYSNFKPQKWQPCLVRYRTDDFWAVRVCSGIKDNDIPVFYNAIYNATYDYILPLSEITEQLIGTKKSYEELIKELDATSTNN